jgi:hypothetical protein
MKKLFLLLVFVSVFVGSAYSQCFGSPGNPAAGTSNLGTLKKKVLRISFFHRYSFSDTYYEGSKKSNFLLYDRANFNFLGNIIAYGVSNTFTIEAETGFFINKTIHYSKQLPFPLPEYTKNGYGLNQTVISGKFMLLTDDKHPVKWSASAGIKIPLRTEPQYHNNTQLPIDAQPSNLAFGGVFQSFLLKENSFKGLRYFMINRFEYNFINSIDYHWGQSLSNAFFISKRLHVKNKLFHDKLTGILQLRHEMRTRNKNHTLSNPLVNSSGSQLVYFTPQINFTAKSVWNISFMVDLPLFQYYNGTQIGNKFSMGLVLIRDIAPKDFIY